MGKIVAICTSVQKGTQKKEVNEINLIENFGLEGDAHGGDWHRQVSLLGIESFEYPKPTNKKVAFSDIKEMDYLGVPFGRAFRSNLFVRSSQKGFPLQSLTQLVA